MKPTVLMVLFLSRVFAQGCSIYKAATAPPPVDVERVRVGSDRTDVISLFGTPKLTEVTDGQRTDMFEFISGYSQASKSRILLYAAGDFFTLGLSELVFWPLELAVLQGTEGRAVATYGSDNKVQIVNITTKDGKPWEH
jgi:hypothetical protein